MNDRVEGPRGFAVKTPKPMRSKSIMFATKGGNLATENPRQARLPLRGLEGGGAEPARDITPDAAPARSV